MMQAAAIRSFTRSDNKERVKIGQVITGDNQYIKELCTNGLVRDALEVGEDKKPTKPVDPSKATGEAQKSSVSQVAQASAKTTLQQSNAGGKNKKR